MTLENRKRFIINTAYFALSISILYLVVKYVLGLLTPFLIGFLVAFLLQRGINLISDRFRIPKKVVALVLVVLFYLVIGFLLAWLGIGLFAQLKDMIEKLPRIYTKDVEPVILAFFGNIERIMARFDLSLVQLFEDLHMTLLQSIGKIVSEISGKAIGTITSTVSWVPGMLLSVILAIISSVFFAVDYTKIVDFGKHLIPQKRRELVVELKDFAMGIGFKYLKAYAVLMFITFTELAIGLSILKVEGAITIAALTAIIDILPVLGTGVVVLPWSLFALVKGNIPLAIGLALLYLLVTVVRNVLEPKLLGRQIGLHPVVILVCMYVGIRVLGIIGLFVFPLTVLIIKYLYENGKLRFDDRPPSEP